MKEVLSTIKAVKIIIISFHRMTVGYEKCEVMYEMMNMKERVLEMNWGVEQWIRSPLTWYGYTIQRMGEERLTQMLGSHA